MASAYKEEAKRAARRLGLEIVVFDWVCVCLKPEPISGKPRQKHKQGTIKID